jgi:alkylation response protein AidB-like acyl-CoA dehydrogenase
MPYRPNLDDVSHLLFNVLGAPARVAEVPRHAEVDETLMRDVLLGAAVFVQERIAPLSRQGDEVGARWKDGQVTMPPGFVQAYQEFWQGGWPALACAPDDGGQGLPAVLDNVLYEWLAAANHGFTMAPGLLHGAYECLKHHGSEALKSRYLDKIASGEWLATMALTEPQAGSDLGLVRTRASLQADGSARLSGTKIFISGGEHDLTENIVHLVLAREVGAPPGPKGLSLFLAPKILPDGSRNAICCERIEEKMGLHGSPTCVLRFDEAIGWPVGASGKGLNAMFVMMNAARLHVALQGIGLLDAAHQLADAYATERLQMRAPGSTTASGGADPIARHPAVQRLLLTQRAWVDGMRVAAYRTGIALDEARDHPDGSRRDSAGRWCSLITPVLKAACTHQAFVGASDCLQVFGGHGYVREWGIEQIVRDSRVAMIYEGTNEIQAIDLLVRKCLPDGGAAFSALWEELDGALSGSTPEHAIWREAARSFGLDLAAIAAASQRDTRLPYELADDVLRASAVLLCGWGWLCIAQAPLAREPRWAEPRRAFWRWVWPEFALRMGIINERMAADDEQEALS